MYDGDTKVAVVRFSKTLASPNAALRPDIVSAALLTCGRTQYVTFTAANRYRMSHRFERVLVLS